MVLEHGGEGEDVSVVTISRGAKVEIGMGGAGVYGE